MREEEVLQCQFQNWYPSFRSLSFRSEIVLLPDAFVSYLLEDGVFLPGHSEAIPSKPRQEQWEAHTDDHKFLRDEEDTSAEPEVPIFADLCNELRAAIHRLGGAVVPKLNWSCPKDTTWISPSGSLKCTNPDEVILLLKSSDTLVHDLCHAFEACEDASRERPDEVVLVLRKWYDLHPEMEFRCFVQDHHLLGISQRDVASHYPVLVQKRETLKALLLQFFEEHIKDKFACKSYVFDVYVTRNEQVKLVDFNTYGGVTLPLLYTWEELNDLAVQAGGRMRDTRSSLESGQANGVHITRYGGLDDKEGTEQADAVQQQLGTMSLHMAPYLEQPKEGLCLQLEQVRKTFGKRTVVDNVSITVRQGEVVGLLGPNGAGKSTVFAMMVGQDVPTDGGVRLGVEDITQLPLESRARLGIGYLTQEPSVFKGLSVQDNILLVLQESGLSKDARASRLQELLQGFRLEHVKDTLGRELSGGERRRTELARALAVNCSGKPPRILLVDEPFAGVDPIGVSEIQGLLRHLRDDNNIGILITDHNVNETLRICDRAYMIYQGKVIAAGMPDDLYGDPFVRLHYLGESFPRV
eukprot:SM000026S08998  [mRNA]  locus=s26:946680:952280:+ [translate_table: standard]